MATFMEMIRDLLEPDVRWAALAIFVAGILLGRLSKQRRHPGVDEDRKQPVHSSRRAVN